MKATNYLPEPTLVIGGKLGAAKLADETGEFAPMVAGSNSLDVGRRAPDFAESFAPRSRRTVERYRIHIVLCYG